ncbi:hypothetical protein IWW50_005891, partial [Coemansia erecta]
CTSAKPRSLVICVPLTMIHEITVPQQYTYVMTVANQYPTGPNASRVTKAKLDSRRSFREYIARLNRTLTYQPTTAISTNRITPNHPHRLTTAGRFIVPVPMLMHMMLNTAPTHVPVRLTACSTNRSFVEGFPVLSTSLTVSVKSVNPASPVCELLSALSLLVDILRE